MQEGPGDGWAVEGRVDIGRGSLGGVQRLLHLTAGHDQKEWLGLVVPGYFVSPGAGK